MRAVVWSNTTAMPPGAMGSYFLEVSTATPDGAAEPSLLIDGTGLVLAGDSDQRVIATGGNLRVEAIAGAVDFCAGELEPHDAPALREGFYDTSAGRAAKEVDELAEMMLLGGRSGDIGARNSTSFGTGGGPASLRGGSFVPGLGGPVVVQGGVGDRGGGSVTVMAGRGNNSSQGGNLLLSAGASHGSGASGGHVWLLSGAVKGGGSHEKGATTASSTRRGSSGNVVVGSGPSLGVGFSSGGLKLTSGTAPDGAAGNVSLRGGDGMNGGDVSIRGGLSNISMGPKGSFLLGSSVDITSGRVVGAGSAPVDASSGHVSIATGSAGRATASGSISVATGSASTGRSGDIILKAGRSGKLAGESGAIRILGGDSAGAGGEVRVASGGTTSDEGRSGHVRISTPGNGTVGATGQIQLLTGTSRASPAGGIRCVIQEILHPSATTG